MFIFNNLLFVYIYFRYIVSLFKEEIEFFKILGYDVVMKYLKYMVIFFWFLIVFVLVQNKEGIIVKQLIREVEWIKRQVFNLGVYIDWLGRDWV